MEKRLRKSFKDRSIGGVCEGIAEYFEISSFFVRLLFIFLPGNLLIYILLSNALPDSPRPLEWKRKF